MHVAVGLLLPLPGWPVTLAHPGRRRTTGRARPRRPRDRRTPAQHGQHRRRGPRPRRCRASARPQAVDPTRPELPGLRARPPPALPEPMDRLDRTDRMVGPRPPAQRPTGQLVRRQQGSPAGDRQVAGPTMQEAPLEAAPRREAARPPTEAVAEPGRRTRRALHRAARRRAHRRTRVAAAQASGRSGHAAQPPAARRAGSPATGPPGRAQRLLRSARASACPGQWPTRTGTQGGDLDRRRHWGVPSHRTGPMEVERSAPRSSINAVIGR